MTRKTKAAKRIRTVEKDSINGGWIARNPKTGKEIMEPGFRWRTRYVARTVVEESTFIFPTDKKAAT